MKANAATSTRGKARAWACATALVLAAFALAFLVSLPAWALLSPSDTCGYAYLDPIAGQDNAYKLVLQGNPRAEEGAYVDLHDVKAGGSAEDGQYTPPWIQQNFAEKVYEVEVRSAIRPNSMAHWFEGCDNLRSADLAWVDGSGLVDVSGMFNGCYSLESVAFGSLDLSYVQLFDNLFEGCSALARVDLSRQKTSSAQSMVRMFADCESLSACNLAGIDLSDVEDISGMFSGCSALAYIDLSSFGASNATDLSDMFEGCSSLESVDLSSFSAGELENVDGMFADCEKLASVDISWLDVSGAEGVMFSGCGSLRSITIGPAFGNASLLEPLFTGGRVWLQADTVEACSSALQMLTYASNKGAPATFTVARASSGIYAIEQTSTHALILRTGQRVLEPGEEMLGEVGSGAVPWDSRRATLRAVNFETKIVPETVAGWFKGCAELESVCGLSNLDVSAVGDLSYLFSGCSSLKSVDLSEFDTSHATSLAHLFEDCSSLDLRDLSSMRTSSSTDFSYLFAGCSSLTSLDLRSFNTSAATNLSHLFEGCSKLESVDLTSFNTSKATDMGSLFAGCSSLGSLGLNLMSFDTSSVRDFSNMFSGCAALTTFDLGVLSMDRVENVSGMFADCVSLAEFTFGPVNLSASSLIHVGMFEGCNELDKVHVDKRTRLSGDLHPTFPAGTFRSSADGKVYDAYRIPGIPAGVEATYTRVAVVQEGVHYAVLHPTGEFVVCYGNPAVAGNGEVFVFDSSGYESADQVPWHARRAALRSVRVDDAEACSEVSSVANWFSGCANLKSANVSGLSDTVNLAGLFDGCPSLEGVTMPQRLSASDATRMFAGCTSLRSVDVSGMYWTSGGAAGMFEGCTALSNVKVGNSLGGASCERLFADCVSLPSIDLSNVNYFGDVAEMFYGCASLTEVRFAPSVRLGNERVRPSMSGMFSRCSALRDLDLTGFGTTLVTDFSDMLRGCTALRTADLSAFDTRKATSMKRMFHGCRSLERVTLGGNFTFRGVALSRLPGSEFPSGAWQPIGASGNPVDSLRAYAADSIPNFSAATYAFVDPETPGLILESVRGDTDDGSAKYTIESTVVEMGNGYVEELASYTLDEKYASNTFSIGDGAKASTWAQVTSKTVKRTAVSKVSAPKRLTGVELGSQVTRVEARAFSDAPSITVVRVKSRALSTKKSMQNCLSGSKVKKVFISTGDGAANRAVANAFGKWSGKKAGRSTRVQWSTIVRS